MTTILTYCINWGSVGDYVNALMFLIVTLFVCFADWRRHKDSSMFQMELNRPIIGFKLDKKQNPDNNSYSIINYGKGSALNIVVAYKDSNADNDWIGYTMCYSLKEAEELQLKWHPSGYSWIVRYNDIFNQVYFTICVDDTIEIIELNDISNTKYRMCYEFEEYIKNNQSDTGKISRLWFHYH